jgi:hypothetical protein
MKSIKARRRYFAQCDQALFLGPFTRYQAKKRAARLRRAGRSCWCVRGVPL